MYGKTFSLIKELSLGSQAYVTSWNMKWQKGGHEDSYSHAKNYNFRAALSMQDQSIQKENYNACLSAQMPTPPSMHKPNATIIFNIF